MERLILLKNQINCNKVNGTDKKFIKTELAFHDDGRIGIIYLNS